VSWRTRFIGEVSWRSRFVGEVSWRARFIDGVSWDRRVSCARDIRRSTGTSSDHRDRTDEVLAKNRR
jgi:hypothetical protein